MSERRGKRTNLNQVETSLKFKKGNLPERRNKVSKTENATDSTPNLWTSEAYGSVARLLVQYNGKTKQEFTDAFMKLGHKSGRGGSYTDKDLHSKYPAVRKRLIDLKILKSGAKFDRALSQGGYTDEELKKFLAAL